MQTKLVLNIVDAPSPIFVAHIPQVPTDREWRLLQKMYKTGPLAASEANLNMGGGGKNPL